MTNRPLLTAPSAAARAVALLALSLFVSLSPLAPGAAPAHAADLAAPPPPPMMGRMLPPVLVDPDAVICSLRPGTLTFQHPYTQPFGPLPAGLLVQVIDVPFSTATDLFVRIKAPTKTVYYGYVRTHDLACD